MTGWLRISSVYSALKASRVKKRFASIGSGVKRTEAHIVKLKSKLESQDCKYSGLIYRRDESM
jgi:hypothetical protein